MLSEIDLKYCSARTKLNRVTEEAESPRKPERQGRSKKCFISELQKQALQEQNLRLFNKINHILSSPAKTRAPPQIRRNFRSKIADEYRFTVQQENRRIFKKILTKRSEYSVAKLAAARRREEQLMVSISRFKSKRPPRPVEPKRLLFRIRRSMNGKNYEVSSWLQKDEVRLLFEGQEQNYRIVFQAEECNRLLDKHYRGSLTQLAKNIKIQNGMCFIDNPGESQ